MYHSINLILNFLISGKKYISKLWIFFKVFADWPNKIWINAFRILIILELSAHWQWWFFLLLKWYIFYLVFTFCCNTHEALKKSLFTLRCWLGRSAQNSYLPCPPHSSFLCFCLSVLSVSSPVVTDRCQWWWITCTYYIAEPNLTVY